MNTRRFVSLSLVAVSSLALFQAASGQTQLREAFKYQGQLKFNGVPVNNDTCDFIFRLFDAQVGGLQIDVNQTNGIQVDNGIFTTELQFVPTAFEGDASWLQVEVQCVNSGPSGWTALSPRTEMTASPNALYAKRGASSTSGGGACCDDLSALYDKAKSEVIIIPVGANPSTPYLAPGWDLPIDGPNRYITGVAVIQSIDLQRARANLYVQPLGASWWTERLRLGYESTWNSGGGAPIKVPAGGKLLLSNNGPPSSGNPVVVTISYYEFF